MLSLGALSFAAPWLLTALIGLPILWWLLRVTPPAPRLLRFPAIRLLFGLNEDEQTPSRTPWWLIALRMVAVAAVILGLSHPLWNAGERFGASGPLVLVVDDGWAAARGWNMRQKALDTLIAKADRAGRNVVIVTTAEPSDGGPLATGKLLTPAAARTALQALQPKPWPVDRKAALTAFAATRFEEPGNIIWLSDGIEDGAAQDFVRALQRRGPVMVMTDPASTGALALTPPVAGEPRLTLTLLRAQDGDGEQFWLRGLDERGRVVMRERARFADGARKAEVAINLPSELRNRLTRIEIENVPSAGAVALVDERYRRRPVGIVSAAADRAQAQPLLAEVFYLERALTPYAEVRKGTVVELLNRPLAVLVVPDGAAISDAARGAILAWMERGGTVLRFAGPRLGQKPDELSPVRLRRGDRTLGGAMSWAQPAKLAPFDEDSPFAGLTLPGDITVSRQVLAEPTLDLPRHTWARLGDGTPLVTAAERGRGRIILVHTSANTDWSNLALSGLYVEMLRRVISLSQGISATGNASAPPVSILDGFGRLLDPPPSAQPLESGTPRISARNPPGLYGNESARVAVNLAAGMKDIPPIGALPAGISELTLDQPGEMDFKPWLLAFALALLILDMWIGLVLRGLAPAIWPLNKVAGAGAAAVLALIVIAGPSIPARAQDGAGLDTRRARDATFETRLAYVLTGDPRIDRVSRAGLEGLSMTLRTRTSVEPKAPLGVDIERDEIAFFPFLYWPVSASQPVPSAKARERIARFLETGGMILFDTRDQSPSTLAPPGGDGGGGGPGATKLRDILRGLAVPALAPIPKGHILTKAFYLLHEFPGRWTGGTVWVESQAGFANDGVSSIIIGANDYAAAWAVDASGQPAYPVVSGGTRQRELAHRFGVNVVMYALTGNYKADQVHVPAILERLGQ